MIETAIAIGPAGKDADNQLFGVNGELVGVRIPVEPKLLEDLIEALASLDFPVNPELYHQPGVVRVEFPAYAGHVEHVRQVLRESGFDPGSVQLFGMLASQAVASA